MINRIIKVFSKEKPNAYYYNKTYKVNLLIILIRLQKTKLAFYLNKAKVGVSAHHVVVELVFAFFRDKKA